MKRKVVLRSAGFLIRSKERFLLGHSTRKPNDIPRQFDGNWTISKGLIEFNESPLQAAIRELNEETNIDLNRKELWELLPDRTENLKPFHSFLVESVNKQVELFLLDDVLGKLQDSSLITLRCNSIISGSHYLRGLPELDAFMFVTREEAFQMVTKSQKHLFDIDFLKEKLK